MVADASLISKAQEFAPDRQTTQEYLRLRILGRMTGNPEVILECPKSRVFGNFGSVVSQNPVFGELWREVRRQPQPRQASFYEHRFPPSYKA
jgi:hypothetical protein